MKQSDTTHSEEANDRSQSEQFGPVVKIIQPGDCFGEAVFLQHKYQNSKTRRSATIIVLQSCALAKVRLTASMLGYRLFFKYSPCPEARGSQLVMMVVKNKPKQKKSYATIWLLLHSRLAKPITLKQSVHTSKMPSPRGSSL